jgi:DNA-binding NarL/FixJ family response regulator
MANSTLRVLVVEDHEPFRRFLSSLLQTKPDLQIICEVADGLEAIQQAEKLQPDLILLDIGIPGLNGIEAARRIRKLAPDSKILFVSMESSPEMVREGLNLGARGYVHKSQAEDELLAAVDAIIQGKQFVSSALAHHVLTGTETPDQLCSEDVPLDARAKHRTEIARHHPLQTYSDDESFLNDFGRFITTALYAQSVVIVVLTESHRVRLLRSLREGGVDVAAAVVQKRFISLDVPDSLPTVVVDGPPDAVRFARVAADLVVEAARAAKGKRTHIAVG